MAVQRPERPGISSTCCPIDFNVFLRSRIRDIETLCANIGQANIVAMDTEHGDGFSSIGLAFAPQIDPVERPIHPADMTISQTICFNIRGFERSKPTRERVWGQPDQNVDAQDVASKVVDAVQEFKKADPEKPLMLVTYSSRAELSAISDLVPRLCSLFSNWVDLQPLVMEAYHSHTDYTRLDGLRISLRYAMRILGFDSGYQLANLHHAGNDALRTLAITACRTHENVQFRRLRELEHVLRVNKHRKEQNDLKGTEKSRGLLRKRPGPPSRYPHVAKVTTVLAKDIGEKKSAGRPVTCWGSGGARG